jgi:hypothetical protein
MNNVTQYDRLRQISIYLLCWGEAVQVRFAPECLCYIFKCADDYHRSLECQQRMEPVPEGLYTRTVIKFLYGREIRETGTRSRTSLDMMISTNCSGREGIAHYSFEHAEYAVFAVVFHLVATCYSFTLLKP